MATSAELLVKVNAAIEAILDGGAVQRFVIRGKDLTAYSLQDLLRLRRELQQEADEEAAGTSVTLARTRPQ